MKAYLLTIGFLLLSCTSSFALLPVHEYLSESNLVCIESDSTEDSTNADKTLQIWRISKYKIPKLDISKDTVIVKWNEVVPTRIISKGDEIKLCYYTGSETKWPKTIKGNVLLVSDSTIVVTSKQKGEYTPVIIQLSDVKKVIVPSPYGGVKKLGAVMVDGSRVVVGASYVIAILWRDIEIGQSIYLAVATTLIMAVPHQLGRHVKFDFYKIGSDWSLKVGATESQKQE